MDLALSDILIFPAGELEDNSGVLIKFQFVNLKKKKKFQVALPVDCQYPYSDFSKAKFTNYYGDTNEKAVHDIVNQVPALFGRITKICTKLKQLM